MKRGVPIFNEAGKVYRADTCEPVKAAVQRGDIRMEALARGAYPGRALPPKELREIKTVGFWDAPRQQSWGLDWHRNEGIEFTYLAGGKTAFEIGNRSFQLGPGDLTITRPWQQHRVGNPNVGASRLHWLILDVGVRRPNQPWRWPEWLLLPEANLRRLTTLLRHNEQPVWRAGPELGLCFERIAEAVQLRKPDLTRLKIYLNELILAIGEILAKKRITLDENLSSTRRTVDLFLQDLPNRVGTEWTLNEMARLCGLKQTRFAWYCKQLTNLSPVEYLARCRVDAAARLLLDEPGWSVTDVALECGFQSSQYFATVFREKLGLTPREYRNRELTQK